MELRPYQTRAVERLTDGFRSGTRRQLLVAPTGAGKTVLAADMLRRAAEHGTPSVFLAPRRELIQQASEKLDAFGVRHGILMAGHREQRGRAVQVCSVETLRRRPWRPAAKLVMVDEAHQRSFQWLMEELDSPWVVGLTATPWRLNGAGLEEDFDDLVLAATPRQLVGEGFLLEPRTFAPSTPDTTQLRVTGGDFNAKDVDALMNRAELVGDTVEHWKTLAEGRPTVAFATSVAHSQAIRDAFVEAGVQAEHIDGTTHYRERARVLKGLERGEVQVVCNCELVTYGWDCPPAACAIVARPTASLVLWIQMAGRILRPHPGKLQPIIIDHAGNALDHGLVMEDRDYLLDRPSEKRRKGKARRAAPLRTCEHCYAVLPISATTCTACGKALKSKPRAVRQEDGTLQEVDEFSAKRLRMAANRRLREKADFFAELERQRRVRRYKPGWSKHRFKMRYGHWPTKEIIRLAERGGTAGDDLAGVWGLGGASDLAGEHGGGESDRPTGGDGALRGEGTSGHQRDPPPDL